MRKILISIVIVLLLVLGYFVLFEGINLFGIEILSVFQIKDKNDELDTQIKNISTITSVEQPKAMSELNDSAKQLLVAKEQYNDKILYSSEENIKAASQTRPYKTEYLWVVLGNHAKKNSINLKYELRQASTGMSGEYDIHFTVTGSYVSISEFVTSLENDSSLNFKIESFRLIPGKDNQVLQATFTVKDITIEVDMASNASNSTISAQQGMPTETGSMGTNE